MEFIRKKQATTTNATSLKKPVANPKVITKQIVTKPIVNKPLKPEGIGTKMDKLINILTKDQMIEETKKAKKSWKIPFKWNRTFRKSTKSSSSEKALCFIINNKGELESPVLLPIFNGNSFVYKYTIHEVDPRDILTFTHRKKFYKVLIYRLMDRKAVSNRDYDEVRARGDSTIDDEVFIKAMLTAKASQISKKQIGKGALVVGGLVVAGVIIWIFTRS